MKKLGLLALLFPMMVNAADWTPVVKYWETGDWKEKDFNISEITANMVDFDEKKKGFYLTKKGKTSNFEWVPLPYRKDLLPTNFKSETSKNYPEYPDLISYSAELVIPFKNATLYGLPIKYYKKYYWIEDNISGSTENIIFGPLTTKQYTQLKNKKFKSFNASCFETQATVELDDKTGDVKLSLTQGCD
ncbi:hypothetical protein A1D22_10625 [Pasteurellaceae bacterium LFhippo2]|nr:hypothetical protein [Pasteurellaceae bacterium LFhippo2]